MRGTDKADNPDAENQREALKKYTIDLTERARQGKLDPVIGRDDEIRRTMQILQRRTKNNPRSDRRTPVLVRPPSWKALLSESSTMKCPIPCATR